MQLFVYGSLKSGESNHAFYMKGQRLLGPARTQEHFRLYELGPYPGLVPAADGIAIEGELWEVDEEAMVRIDQLEDAQGGVYQRARITLAEPPTEAIVYLYQGDVSHGRECGSRWTGTPQL